MDMPVAGICNSGFLDTKVSCQCKEGCGGRGSGHGSIDHGQIPMCRSLAAPRLPNAAEFSCEKPRKSASDQFISLYLSISLELVFNSVCNTRGSFNTCLSKNQLILKIPCRKFSYSEIFQTILDFSFTEILLFEMGFFL